MPVFNGADFLPDSIDSILKQDYPTYELIIIDDGSIDKSRDIISSYPDIRYYYQENNGVAAARNRGIAESRGEYIAFIDADDIWPQNKLAIQIAYMEAHPEIGYSFTRHRLFLNPGLEDYPDWVRKDYAASEHIAYIPSSLVVRREVLDAVGHFDPSYKVGEDSDWFLRAKDASIPMTVIEETLLLKRIHTQNMSRQAAQVHTNMLRAIKASLLRRNATAGRGEE
jgi:glycosyltransferase involved in cell wall biosynthesis